MQAKWSGIGIVDGRGSIGGTQLSKNMSGSIASLKTIPRFKRSARQSTQRITYRTVLQKWRNLTEAERTAWDVAAALPENERTNSVGDTYQPTGQSLFIECNLNVYSYSYPIITPSAHPTWTAVQLQSATVLASTTIQLFFTPSSIQANEAVYIFATGSLSVGRMSIKQPYFKFITSVNNSTYASTMNIASWYTGAWYAPKTPSKTIFCAYLRDRTGGYSTPCGCVAGLKLE